MASLATHLWASLFLVPIGLTRLLRSSSLFLKNPSLFKSKPWYILSEPKWKNLDLFALAIALPIASFSEIFLFSTVSDDPARRFALAHQSLVLFLFWALVVSVVFRESVDFFRGVVDEGLVFVLAGVSFLSEYWVTGKGIEGLFASVYDSVGLLSLLCGLCSLYLAVNPSSFWAEFLLSSGLVFKGTWVLQIGLSLYTETFGFKGCGLEAENLGVAKCELEQDGFRAVALMRLLFVSHSILVLVFGFVSFGLLSSRKRGSTRFGDQDGLLLSQLESETAMMPNDSAELEME